MTIKILLTVGIGIMVGLIRKDMGLEHHSFFIGGIVCTIATGLIIHLWTEKDV